MHDEHVASLVCTLFHQLTAERRQRLLGKFAEDGLAKLTKLLKLRGAYDEKVAFAEASVVKLQDEEAVNGQADSQDRLCLARIDAGVHILHALDMVLGYVATGRNKPLRVAVLRGLYEQGCSLHDVWANIDEHTQLFGGAVRSDSTRDKQLAAMGDAVRGLLAKY